MKDYELYEKNLYARFAERYPDLTPQERAKIHKEGERLVIDFLAEKNFAALERSKREAATKGISFEEFLAQAYKEHLQKASPAGSIEKRVTKYREGLAIEKLPRDFVIRSEAAHQAEIARLGARYLDRNQGIER